MTAKEAGAGKRAEGWAPYTVVHPVNTVTLGSLELTSIALGFSAADAMVKAAGVEMIDARAVCPGKFFILICGTVADTEASIEAGIESAMSGLSSHTPGLRSRTVRRSRRWGWWKPSAPLRPYMPPMHR
jgi:hypothetical protein